jgi:hypothetical protein
MNGPRANPFEVLNRAEQRRLHELLTHPRPRSCWPELEALAAAFDQSPAAPPSPPTPPALDLAEVARLLCRLAAAEWDTSPPPLEALAAEEPAEEVTRQVLHAFWQSLLYDPRG